MKCAKPEIKLNKIAYTCYFETQLEIDDFSQHRREHYYICNERLLTQIEELQKNGIQLLDGVSNEILIQSITNKPHTSPHKSLIDGVHVNMLEESMVNHINTIAAHFQSRDWDAFKKSVHKFKSSCLYCVTTRLLKLTQTLEKLADTKDLNQIKPIYQQFNDCITLTKQSIENWLSMQQN